MERKGGHPLAAAFLKNLQENGKPKALIQSRAGFITIPGDWELRNCMESAVVMAKGNIVSLEDLPPTVSSSSEKGYIRINLGTSLPEAEKEIIRSTLNFENGNKSKTAEVLGIGRKTLHRKLQEYGLSSS